MKANRNASGTPGGSPHDDDHGDKTKRSSKLPSLFSALLPRKRDRTGKKTNDGAEVKAPRQPLHKLVSSTSSASSSAGGKLDSTANESRYAKLDAKLSQAVRNLDDPRASTADFEHAAALADQVSQMKPDKDYLHRGGLFQKAMRAGKFDLMLLWMRNIDNERTHSEFLSDVASGLEDTQSSPVVQRFIEGLSRYYLEELPAAVFKSPGALPGSGGESSLSPNDLFEVMARFAGMAKTAGWRQSAHGQQLFDKLPLNLYQALEAMPSTTARRMFSSLNDLRDDLKIDVGEERASLVLTINRTPKTLTPLDRRRGCMVKACHAFTSLLRATDHGVRMGARMGEWALKGRAYEEAAFRISEVTPDDDDVRRSIMNRSMRPRPVDISGLDLESLPKGIETLNYITQLDLSNNKLQRIPMEMYDMKYFSPYRHQIEIDLRGNPLSRMTPEELTKLDNSKGRLSGPWFKMPPVVELEGGGTFQSSQALVLRQKT